MLRTALVAVLLAVLARFAARRPVHNAVAGQGLHYFSRPGNGGVRRAPILAEHAWRGEDLRRGPASRWKAPLTSAEAAELLAAVETFDASGADLHAITAATFPLPLLAPKIAALRTELTRGLGFFVWQGVPVSQMTVGQAEICFAALGQHLGIAGAQNNDGDLVGHVTDVGGDAATGRLYRTHAEIGFHCDAADVVGLLCLGTSATGGASRLISSATVYNEMLKDHADLVPTLYEPFLLDTRGTGGVDFLPVEFVRAESIGGGSGEESKEGGVRTFYHKEYFSSAYRHPAAGKIPKLQQEALDAYGAITERPDLRLDMQLAVGDAQFVNNHYLLHARAAYEDRRPTSPTTKETEEKAAAAGKKDDEAAPRGHRRHMLRLWLSLDTADMPLAAKASKLSHKAVMASRIVKGKVRGFVQRRGGE